MNYQLRLLPEVEEDAFAGYLWYQKKSVGLGDEFLQEFYDGANGLLDSPLLYQSIREGIRRLLLRRFPYAIYFTIEDGLVLVIGVFHCARDPHAIDSEVDERIE